MNAHCAEIFLQPFDALGAGDRDYVRPLRQQPGEAELRGSAAFLLGDCFDALHQLTVLGEIIAHEAGVTAARVALGQISEIGDGAGQQAAAERGVGDKGDAEVAGELARLGRLLPIKE